MINAVEKLNLNSVSIDNLQSLAKCWPHEEMEGLLQENSEGQFKWDVTEEYFITLSQKKKFDSRLKVWLCKLQFEKTIDEILG